MYKPQSKEAKEFEAIFTLLNPLHKNYALGVLRSLYFAQESVAQEKSIEKIDTEKSKQQKT